MNENEKVSGGTLGDLSILDLIRSADREVSGLSKYLDEKHPLINEDDALLRRAYFGSIRSRLAVAEMKVREEAAQ